MFSLAFYDDQGPLTGADATLTGMNTGAYVSKLKTRYLNKSALNVQHRVRNNSLKKQTKKTETTLGEVAEPPLLRAVIIPFPL